MSKTVGLGSFFFVDNDCRLSKKVGLGSFLFVDNNTRVEDDVENNLNRIYHYGYTCNNVYNHLIIKNKKK